MIVKRCFAAVLIVCVCAGLTAGCRTKGNGEEELPMADVLQGEYPLQPWDDPGRRVTSVRFETVLFVFDSSLISRTERHKIETVGRYLKSSPRVRVILEGHCDERGSREYNMALGERRGLAIRAYLISLGINSSRLLTKSYGEEKPVNPGHNEGAWRLNRRVEFAIYR